MEVSKKILVVIVAVMATSLWADVYTFRPSHPTLNDLPHQCYFTWGVKWELPQGEEITSATLTFKNIWNQTREPNILYTHLLDDVPDPNGSPSYQAVGTGKHAYERITIIETDSQGEGDSFADWPGDHVLLGMWTDNHGGQPRNFDLVYNISSDHFGMLANGAFGFGIDPDCHYFNDGITFSIVTSPAVPAPAAMGLGAIGLAIVFWSKRFLGKREG